jgi:hypothetical protein
MLELKARASIYQPVKDDSLDMRLCEYINSCDRSRFARVTFQRESQGVYTFGSKRVQLELTNNKLKARVGGGPMSIEEFVD